MSRFQAGQHGWVTLDGRGVDGGVNAGLRPGEGSVLSIVGPLLAAAAVQKTETEKAHKQSAGE
jgi:hypothetical protein